METSMTDTHLTEMNVPLPDVALRKLKFSFGPSRIKLGPGDFDAWVEGTYEDPTGFLPLRIDENGGNLHIAQDFRRGSSVRHLPQFNLRLGKGGPYAIQIEARANQDSEFDFGGLPLTELEITHGAGKFPVNFSAPNSAEMSKLHVSCGATDTRLINLANANADVIAIDTGAASVKLDFGGTLSRDTSVAISSGIAQLEVTIPSTTAAKVIPTGFLGGKFPGTGFMNRDGVFLNDAAIAGDTPVLTIAASVNLSSFSFSSV